MANKQITVQLASPERKYVKTYHDFLDNSFLTTEEQMVFIVLKSYVDFSSDSGDVFPSMNTICKRSKLSEPRARRTINSMIKKGIVKKIQRGLTKTNLYTLADYPTIWACNNTNERIEIINNGGTKPLTLIDYITGLEKLGYKVEIKEKELVSDSDQTSDTSTNKNYAFSNEQNTTNEPKSQAERYTIQDIRILYEYDSLIMQYPKKKTDIDIIFDILYDTLNSTKQCIRVGGEDKPAMVVIGKLMKLDYSDLVYSIDKYHEQTERIKNVKNYLLTILYNSKEQQHLDIMNLGHVNHDF